METGEFGNLIIKGTAKNIGSSSLSYTSQRHKLGFFANVLVGCADTRERRDDRDDTLRVFASLRLCVKLGNKNAKMRGRKDAKIE
ncbi:MAG: hypothetical protein U9Q68_07990 [Euryarchaeota archaeon]|nr:hypothetical protein [Euryarchaeota archaeon]